MLSLRILIVDDNTDLADSMALLIGLNGHETFVAYDAETGLELAAKVVPHVIFHDIALPGMSGYDAAVRLRMDVRLKPVILVAHTAFSTDADRARAMAVGFDHFLSKPLDPASVDDLLTSISRRVDQARL